MRTSGVPAYCIRPYLSIEEMKLDLFNNVTTIMSPRLHLLSRSSSALTVQLSYQPLAPFLYPVLPQQQRTASILSSLSDVKGAYNKRIRVGRGPSSGYGKTSGRGHKGQKQHGKVPAGFNGGQTPDEVVHGKRGFENQYASRPRSQEHA